MRTSTTLAAFLAVAMGTTMAAPAIQDIYCDKTKVSPWDEDQAVKCFMKLTDDVGIDFAAAALVSPSGRQVIPLYFNENNKVAGTLKLGYFRNEIIIPRSAEPGYWQIAVSGANAPKVTSTSGETAAYGEQDFVKYDWQRWIRVAASLDTEAPELLDLWCDTPVSLYGNETEDYNPSKEIHCYAKVFDEGSGPSAVNAYFVSPSAGSVASFYFSYEDVQSKSGNIYILRANHTFYPGSEPGVWTLVNMDPFGVFVEDRAGNNRTYEGAHLAREFPRAGFEIKSIWDKEPTILGGLSCTPQNIEVTSATGNVPFICQLIAQDNLAGFAYAMLTFVSPNGDNFQTLRFDSQSLQYMIARGGVYKTEGMFNATSQAGIWSIDKNGITLVDKVGNQNTYTVRDLNNMGAPTYLKVVRNVQVSNVVQTTSGSSSTSASFSLLALSLFCAVMLRRVMP